MVFTQVDKFSTKLSDKGDEKEEELISHENVSEVIPELKEPPMYQVVLLNDDYTPMDYVVEILESFFSKSREEATKIMLAIHHDGKGICGQYRNEIAEMKVLQVNQHAKLNDHPLMAIMEQL